MSIVETKGKKSKNKHHQSEMINGIQIHKVEYKEIDKDDKEIGYVLK